MSLQKPLIESEKEYKIRRQGDGHHYRVSVDRELLEEAGIEHKQRLGVTAHIEGDNLVIDYTQNLDSDALTISATHRDSAGEVVIPSGVGAIFSLEGNHASSVLHETDGDTILSLETTCVVPEADVSDASPLMMKELQHIQQDISRDGSDWQQEQFRLYMGTSDLAELGWTCSQSVGLKIKQVAGKPVIAYDADVDDVVDKMQKKVSETGVAQADGLLYTPNDVVKTLGLVDRECLWVADGGLLVAIPQD